MRKQIEPLPEQAELTINPSFQSSPMVIRGADEVLESMAADFKAQDAKLPLQAIKHAITRRKPAVEALRSPDATFIGRIATDFGNKLFDARYHTNLYEQKVQQRIDEKIVARGVKIGLISMTDTVCQRHAHAVDKLRV